MSIFLLAAIALFASCFYLPWAIVRLANPWAQQPRRRRALLAVLIVGCAAVVGGYRVLVGRGFYTLDVPAAGMLYNVLGLLFMVHVYATFSALLVQLALALVGALRRSPQPRRTAVALVVGVPCAAVAYGFAAAQNYAVSRIDIEVDALAQPVSFLHAPDIHLGHQRDARYMRRIAETIAAEKPDFVLYNGDLFDSNAGLKAETFDVLRGIATPQYFTTGNHEFYMDTEGSLQGLREAGVRVLSSERVDIRGVQLVGLEYMNADAASRDPHSVNNLHMNEELPKVAADPARPIVVAHHSPVGAHYVAAYGADLYVAGHTHGGQVWPATWLVGRNFPIYKGVERVGDTTVVVSQGAGTFGPWMRLGSRSEVQLITLRPRSTRQGS